MQGRVVGGKYELEVPLGAGGTGQVWRSRHRVTKRAHAVKLISTLGQSENVLTRFLREAEAFAHIRHPGVVEILDAGRDADGTLYLVMECLEGRTYRAFLETPGRRPWEGADLLRDALEPLMAAHEATTPEGVLAPLVHRDLKPENLFVLDQPLPPPPGSDRPTRVKLLDFGIARWVGTSGPTAAGVTLGTPLYASPEQVRDPRSVTARADVWSMGVMLHETFSGATPFGGQSYYEVVAKIWDSPPPRLPAWAPAPLVALVDECLAKDPATRPENARSMARRMDVLLAEAAGAAIPASSISKPSSGSRARPSPDGEIATVPTEIVLPLVRPRTASAGPVAAVSASAVAALGPPAPSASLAAGLPQTRAAPLDATEAAKLAEVRKNAPVFNAGPPPAASAAVPASRPILHAGMPAAGPSGSGPHGTPGSGPQGAPGSGPHGGAPGSGPHGGSGPQAVVPGSGPHTGVPGSGSHATPGSGAFSPSGPVRPAPGPGAVVPRFSAPASPLPPKPKFSEEAAPDANALPGYGRLRLTMAFLALLVLGGAAAAAAWFYFPH